ncbi:MAG: 2-C-methyl-D-erythritol 4-phosphate cytidylyltransferase [Eubacteriales bacterium]|nr:2-C-methyl-D-erythritol 4-phosphate cytidylyltransferase [Eubacteriales bacterium]MDD3199430.1 2-C-methyl-D-erythritol 4-phosphate cytidylyltransferase [Eubacteriales bacterium]MDD4121756.1 2-C-methyl-D-erythritol 4-phosphate cytidylyltransferase [Eubacteriales bacterium]MDD4630153.1 2-C-methyl-D-erythritol 4-phosphate cytidylyltransferase [Eubacteriales bacterium]
MTIENKTAVIIAAAGSGMRMGGGIPKQYKNLGGMSILARTVKAFAVLKEVHLITVVTNENYLDDCRKELDSLGLMSKNIEILSGGQERQDSIYNAIRRLPEDVQFVLVHDGVRPFVTTELILKTIEAAKTYGAAAVAVPVKDTIKMAEDGFLTDTLDRRHLFAMQTPQGFRKELLVRAYEEAYKKNIYGTDDAFLVEIAGEKVYVVKGNYFNIKITTLEDIVFGEAILNGNNQNRIKTGMRIGTGYDVHKLVQGRKLILGGVEIPFETGLLGHSDADVLLHALMDALLGAAALGDVGIHFPDSDDSYRGVSSLLLLSKVGKLLEEKRYKIVNIDATVIAQRPKISPYIGEMILRISETLGIEEDKVNIKGTTTEKLGFCGREEGIAAQVSVLIIRRNNL